ncbi:RimJ/RimL family protein N-acetyltransferase [Dongia mobilis]|uniref:RimJ/RimL family protein N-acetyltransferase n=1 Tax=Dongia mobilis TaxID=578943 RepID=A0A4R6WVY1_9PROT|nr:GNAT family N-acetyltransferase [Dongia mobilis]TDQ84194.1 RimJ/RimL family protein N-acetyltransferase [Dongia mobilis]
MPITVPDLTTTRLDLRPLTPRDAVDVVRLVNDFEVARYTATIPHPYDIDMAREFIAAPETAADAGERFPDDPEGAVVLAIALREDGRLLGCIGLQKTPEGTELGYWIGRQYWGMGYTTEAAVRITRLAFETYRLPFLIASAVTINDASHRVLEKVGFAVTGTGEIHSRAQNSALPVVHRRLDLEDWQRRSAAADSQAAQ